MRSNTYALSTDQAMLRLLEEWIRCIKRIDRDWACAPRNDCPWNYTERPLLSILSGAAYNLGGYGVQEYASDKAHPDKRRRDYGGREDLYLRMKSRDLKIEAKHCWSPLGSGSGADLKRNLRRACEDIRKCHADGQERWGVLFAAPIFRTHLTVTELSRDLETWLSSAKQVRCTAFAAVFPSARRDYRSDLCYFSPGVGVFLQRVWRS